MIRERLVIKLSGDEIGKVDGFKYLGFVLQKNGNFENDMKYRIKCG